MPVDPIILDKNGGGSPDKKVLAAQLEQYNQFQ